MENIFKVCFIIHLSLTLAKRGLNIPQYIGDFLAGEKD